MIKNCWLLKIFFQSDFLKLLKVASLRVVNWGCIQYNQYIQYNQFHNFNVPQSFALVDIMWIELIQFAVKRIKIRTRPGLVDVRFL